jgi:excisionase family DNA binding protein
MSTTVHHRPLLSVAEAAERLRVSEKTVRRLIDAEVLPALRVSARTVRVDPDELDSWLYAEAPGGTPAPDASVVRCAPDEPRPAVEVRPHAGEGR